MKTTTTRAAAILGRTELTERTAPAVNALKHIAKALGDRDAEIWPDKLTDMLEQTGEELGTSLETLTLAVGNVTEIIDDLAIGFDETDQKGDSSLDNLDDITKYAAEAANALGLLHTQLTIAHNRVKYSAK